jgi:hypothetical protein
MAVSTDTRIELQGFLVSFGGLLVHGFVHSGFHETSTLTPLGGHKELAGPFPGFFFFYLAKSLIWTSESPSQQDSAQAQVHIHRIRP